MIELLNARVTSLDVDFHEVTWKVAPTSEDVLDYEVHVLRSEAEEGPFEDLTGPLVDRYHFIDNIIQVQNRWRRYHYLLRVIRRGTDETRDFGPCSNEPAPDLLAMELRRHMRLLFTEFAGRRCIVLPARTFGQRCGCWNATLEKRTRSGCVTCFDTGWVRGYLHAVEAWIQVDPSPKTKQVTATGSVTQQDNTTMRMGYYPAIKPGDLIVEAENKRWRVIQQNQTEHSRAPVHQELQVHRIPEKDIEFRIPVSFSDALPNLYFTPRRNFTNPTNLENKDGDQEPGIFSIYRY